ATGFLIFTQLTASSGFLVIAIGSTIMSLGSSPLFTLTNDLIIGTAPPERAGAAAGMSETAAEFGGALGIAIFGSIGVALYRGSMTDAVPASVPSAAADAARDTLGGAIDVAAQLPGQVGTALIDAARDAYTYGLHVAALISAAGSILLAILVLTLLRNARTGGESEEQEELEDATPTEPADAVQAEVATFQR
ncbi:MAG TPA: MFS transporter, partial [Actinomycetota bacterium]|nr:MFS transporter [Actinomycetota bacterium]